MSDLLFRPVIPQALFIDLAAVDRATFDNWARAGLFALGRSDAGKPLVSFADVLKVKMMLGLRDQLAMPPRHSAALADQLLDSYRNEIISALAYVVRALRSAADGEPWNVDQIDRNPLDHAIFSDRWWIEVSPEGEPVLRRDDKGNPPGTIRLLLPMRYWVSQTAGIIVGTSQWGEVLPE